MHQRILQGSACHDNWDGALRGMHLNAPATRLGPSLPHFPVYSHRPAEAKTFDGNIMPFSSSTDAIFPLHARSQPICPRIVAASARCDVWLKDERLDIRVCRCLARLRQQGVDNQPLHPQGLLVPPLALLRCSQQRLETAAHC